MGNLVAFYTGIINQNYGIVGIILLNISAILYIVLPHNIKNKYTIKRWTWISALPITVVAFMVLAHCLEKLSMLGVESQITPDLEVGLYEGREKVREMEQGFNPDEQVEIDSTEIIIYEETVSDYSEKPPYHQDFSPDEHVIHLSSNIDKQTLAKTNKDFEGEVLVANYEEFKSALRHFIPGQRIVLVNDIYLKKHLVIEDIDSLIITGQMTEENAFGFFNFDTTAVSFTFVNCDDLQIVKTGFVYNNIEPILYLMCFKNCKNVSVSNSYFMNDHQYSLVFDEATNIALLEGNAFKDYLSSGVFFYAFQTHNIQNNEFIVGGAPDPYYNNYKIAKIDVPEDFNPSLNIENIPFVYPHSFGYPFGESFTHNDNIYKAYDGSMEFALFAFGVYEVLAKELSLNYYGYKHNYIYGLFRAMSGIHPFTFDMQDLKSIDFKQINPQFVEWATKFIKPGLVDEAFYEASIRRTSRMLIECYLYLKKNEDFPAILEEYISTAEQECGNSFLKNRYHSTLNHYNDKNIQLLDREFHFNEPYHVSYIMGFWLRRMIDGSDDAIWTACCKFMRIYDEQWLKEIESKYKVRLKF